MTKTKHSGDCHYYSPIINNSPLDGICTCGYGLETSRSNFGDGSDLISEERNNMEQKRSVIKALENRDKNITLLIPLDISQNAYDIIKNENQQLEKSVYIKDFVKNCCSSWVARNYETYCIAERQEQLENPPIEDFEFLAEKIYGKLNK